MRADTWRDRAACRGVPLAVFFPASEDDCDEAKAICAGCPARRPCLDDALKNGLQGVWGGTSERERRVLAREHRKAS
ncbi:MAG: WhiB family transcriptional regulator [Actinomycetota bacterium]|nr:WhiB family transcriptional regulator [Actinomycetota bacterium]